MRALASDLLLHLLMDRLPQCLMTTLTLALLPSLREGEHIVACYFLTHAAEHVWNETVAITTGLRRRYLLLHAQAQRVG